MFTWIAKRLLYILPVLFGSSLIVFSMVHLTPGDPAQSMLGPFASKPVLEQLRQDLGLNEPLYVQYWQWISRAATGDLGKSIALRSSVSDEILARLTPTVILVTTSFVIAVVLGVLIGVLSAVYRNSWLDRIAMGLAMVGVSMPSFYLGMVLLVTFSLKLSWLPMGGYTDIASQTVEWGDVLIHLILPAATLSAGPMAVIARMIRSAMLDEIGKNYVRTARSKGLRERRVIGIHALKNALIPTVNLLGLQMGFLLASTALVEVVFAYPGIGDLLIRSIITRDLPVTQGVVLLITLAYSLINLVTDVSHGLLDPTIRFD